MKSKLLLLLFFLFSGMNLCAQAVWNNTSFVHRNNQQLQNGQNDVISLKGVNLGGWLLWEGWLWGEGLTQEKTIYNKIESVVGASSAAAFRDSVHQNFITRQDIQKISEECFNVVRIPFNHTLLEDDFTPYVYKPEGWAILDSVLQWCEDYNVYAILDLHSAPGGQSNFFTADPDLFINLWNGAINQNRTRRLWKAIADRYKNRGIIAGYDLLNEPSVATDSDMLNMYNGIIDSIRSVDNNHMLIIEGNDFAIDFSMFASLPDPNVCFEFHFYTWFFSNNIAANLNEYTLLSDALNVPVWCGEWGENDWLELDTTLTLLNDPSFKVSGNAFWPWKKMKDGSTYSYYNGIETTAEWTNTIDWISNAFLPTPTAVEMQTGMNAFIQNCKIQNCTFNDTMSGLLRLCLPPAGIQNPDQIDVYLLYPNPTSDNLTIKSPQKHNSEITIRTTDGRGVYTKKFAKNTEIHLNIKDLSPGIYLLDMNSNEETKLFKFLKE